MTDEPQSVPIAAVRAYTRVLNLLRDRINSGHYIEGDWLPTERELGEDLNVNRKVVRAAVNQLVRDGLVDRQPHCRPVVAAARQNNTATTELADGVNGTAPLSLLVRDINQSLETLVSPSPRDPSALSNFVALLMWNGGGVLELQSSQQRIFWGMNEALAEEGYHAVFLNLGQLGDEDQNAQREAAQLKYVLERGFGGAVMYPYAYRSNQALVKEVMRSVPLVLIDRRISPLETDFVGMANYQAMFDTVKHLVDSGHRRIAYVTKFEAIQPVEDRIQGYIDAIREANLEELILPIPSHDADWDWTVVDLVFSQPEGKRPTAAAVFNDYAACLFLERLEHLGLSVPVDVALTGFDNIIPALQNGLELTTVAQPYEEIGITAARLLLQRIKAPQSPFESVILPGKLIARNSSALNVR